MARSTVYNQPACNLTIDGTLAQGFGDDFMVQVVPDVEGSSTSTGLDGVTTSISFSKSATVTLSLMPTSPTNDLLAELWDSQNSAAARQFDISFTSGVGENIHLSRCAIKKFADLQTGGPEKQNRTYEFSCEDYVTDKSLFS